MYKSGKKKRKGIKILIFLAVVAMVLAGVYSVLQSHTVRNVYVEGNVHYSKEEIQDMVMGGPLGNNSLYLSFVYKDKQITDIPFIARLTVEVPASDTIRIRVEEKALAGYVEYLGHYMYFDMDGTVVESSSVKTEGVPQITGLNFDHVVLNKPLPVEDDAIFYTILNITKILEKNELNAERIYFNLRKEMTLYFADIKVVLGSDELLEEKIEVLPKLLPELSGKSGTLDMQKYDGTAASIPFKPDS